MPDIEAAASNATVQALIDGEAAGSSFTIKSGTHTGRSFVTKSGNKYYSETGAIFDGGGTTAFAIQGYAGKDNVEVHALVSGQKLEIKNYTDVGIDGRSPGSTTNLGLNWIIEDVFVHDIAGTTEASAIRCGNGWAVRRFEITACPYMAFRNTGTGSLFEDGEIYANATGGNANRAGFSKLAQSTSGTIGRRLNIHDIADGINVIWTDCQAGHDAPAVFEFCTFKDCGEVVHHEISRAITLQFSLFVRCGEGGTNFDGSTVTVKSSSALHLIGNRFYDCTKPFGAMQTGRWAQNSCSGTDLVPAGTLNKIKDHVYQDNEVWLLATNPARVSGLIHPSGDLLQDPNLSGVYWNPYADGNMQWLGNKYHVADTISPTFAWWSGSAPTGVNADLTWAQWQAAGMDVGGSIDFFPAGSPPPEPELPTGEPPAEPPAEEPGSGGGPIPAQVRVSSRIIVPVSARF